MISQRFIIVAGKGGVGRTTLSAALALSFARSGRKTLLATADGHERHLARIFGRKIDTRHTKVADNLHAVHIRPMDSIKEYALMILKLRYLQHLLVGTRAMQSFISNIPGISEWAIMGKVTYHLIEKENGRFRYDRIVLDAPPTGHSLSLIKIPMYISKVTQSGPLHTVAAERLQLLTDPATTGILLVMIPEEMAVTEALEMHDSILSDIRIPVVGALVNRTMDPLFLEADEQALTAMAREGRGGDLVKAAMFRISRRKLQKRQIDRIQGRMNTVILPEIQSWRMDMGDIQALAAVLENNLLT
jgi:anion-transporting  ArsA/GET3 family ATPase